MNYHYLNQSGSNKLVFANILNIRDTLRVSQVNFQPKDKDLLPVYQDEIALTEQVLVSDPDCSPCDQKYQAVSVTLSISGPLKTTARKKALIAALARLVAEGGYDSQFNGFPANPTTLFTISEDPVGE